jgi:phage terminase large subunit-like protein
MAETAKPKHAGGRPRGVSGEAVEQHKLDGTYEARRHDPHYKDRDKPLSLVKPKLESLPTLKDTKRWIRNAADERAVANGCRFSEELADYTVTWIRTYLRFTEGIWAGKPFELMDWQRDELFYPLFGWVKLSTTPPFDGLFIRRFNRTYCEVPKKNGKSPTGAAIGTYMWAGDGETGANVYSAATDRDQASIVHTHAIEMVEAAPELKARCKINRTNRHMHYRPAHAVYRVVSSRAAGAEGLNGNCAILDELHAWQGDVLYNALRYLFAARAEPILFQITTAGDDMDSVCRQQHDYADAVIKGDIEDDAFLPILYGAGPDDDVFDEAIWEKANPSLDHIVSRDELGQALLEAKGSPGRLASLKRYRFDIWGTAENPFLSHDKWATCVEDYDEASLAGKPCIAALDLSRVVDMTALLALFPSEDEPDVYRQLAWFWLPEDTIESRKHLAPFQQWVDDGWIIPTPGGEVCYPDIKAKILELKTQFDLRALLYDPMFATSMTQELEEEHGIIRVEFRQLPKSYAEPTAEYERLVNMGGMRHNGNDVLTWQAGNCTVVETESKCLRPVKRKRGDYRTVDGIVAAIMALSGTMGDQMKPALQPTVTILR